MAIYCKHNFLFFKTEFIDALILIVYDEHCCSSSNWLQALTVMQRCVDTLIVSNLPSESVSVCLMKTHNSFSPAHPALSKGHTGAVIKPVSGRKNLKAHLYGQDGSTGGKKSSYHRNKSKFILSTHSCGTWLFSLSHQTSHPPGSLQLWSSNQSFPLLCKSIVISLWIKTL